MRRVREGGRCLRMSRPKFSARTLTVAALGALLCAGGAVGIASWMDSPAPSHSAAREAARGFTDEVTVPVLSPEQFRPSVPRPDTLPPMIRSTGACKVAMDKVRDFQEANPSGLALDADAAQELSSLMRGVDPQLDPQAACPDASATKFRLQEFEPWMTWAPQPGTELKPAKHPKKIKQAKDASTAQTPEVPTDGQ